MTNILICLFALMLGLIAASKPNFIIIFTDGDLTKRWR